MMNRSRRTIRRRGQALVEFALIAPILILLVMGIVEFGRVFMAQQTITSASREGARTGILPNSTTSDVENIVTTYMSAASLSGATSIQCSNVGPTVQSGAATSVTVSYTLPILTGTIIPGIGQSMNLTNTTVMRHE